LLSNSFNNPNTGNATFSAHFQGCLSQARIGCHSKLDCKRICHIPLSSDENLTIVRTML